MRFWILTLGFFASSAFADLTVYTDRSTELLQPLADTYEISTGVKVNIVFIKKYEALLQRLETEGDNSFADLIFVKDMIFLNDLTDNGFFQPMSAESPQKIIAQGMRHPKNLWTAVTIRPRTIVYNKNLVNPSELSDYADLAKPDWEGKVCLRTSQKSYNKALVSSLIHNLGYVKTFKMVSGWVKNLALSPLSSDGAVLEAIKRETCHVGLVNSYYLAGKLKDDPTYPVAILFANQGNRGAHVNGTGIGVAQSSKQPEEASKFIDFLLTNESQQHFAKNQLDYPAKKGLIPETLIKDWGVFNADSVNWSFMSFYTDLVEKIFEDAEYL